MKEAFYILAESVIGLTTIAAAYGLACWLVYLAGSGITGIL